VTTAVPIEALLVGQLLLRGYSFIYELPMGGASSTLRPLFCEVCSDVNPIGFVVLVPATFQDQTYVLDKRVCAKCFEKKKKELGDGCLRIQTVPRIEDAPKKAKITSFTEYTSNGAL
jgi:hypothetical protein